MTLPLKEAISRLERRLTARLMADLDEFEMNLIELPKEELDRSDDFDRERFFERSDPFEFTLTFRNWATDGGFPPEVRFNMDDGRFLMSWEALRWSGAWLPPKVQRWDEVKRCWIDVDQER